VQQHLDGSGDQPVPDNGGGVDRDTASMEKPVSLHYLWPLLLEILPEIAQSNHGVVGIDGEPM
jgi:hypothetical protein